MQLHFLSLWSHLRLEIAHNFQNRGSFISDRNVQIVLSFPATNHDKSKFAYLKMQSIIPFFHFQLMLKWCKCAKSSWDATWKRWWKRNRVEVLYCALTLTSYRLQFKNKAVTDEHLYFHILQNNTCDFQDEDYRGVWCNVLFIM